jgi:hypothetical protein
MVEGRRERERERERERLCYTTQTLSEVKLGKPKLGGKTNIRIKVKIEASST